MAPFWTAGSTVLPGCAQTSLKHLKSTCVEDVLHVLLFLHYLSAICCLSLFFVSCFNMSSLVHEGSFSFVTKEVMACTSHVSHPFDSVHVLFVALYCVKSRETYTVRRVSFRADLQLRNRVKGRAQGTRLLYSNSARVRKRSRAHTQGRK